MIARADLVSPPQPRPRQTPTYSYAQGVRRGQVRAVATALAAWSMGRGSLYVADSLWSAVWPGDLSVYDTSPVYDHLGALPAWAWGAGLVAAVAALYAADRTGRRRLGRNALWALAGLHTVTGLLIAFSTPLSPATWAAALSVVAAVFCLSRADAADALRHAL